MAIVILCATLLPVISAHAAQNLRALRLAGSGGDSFVVVASAEWRLDFDHAVIAGGGRYAGLAVELLGHPAADGLSTLMVKLPNQLGGSDRTVSTLGASHITMPAGRYLLILLGDRPVRIAVPLSAHTQLSPPAATRRHRVAFAETAGGSAFAPQATGLYDGHVTVRVPAMDDPILMTRFVVRDGSSPHSFGWASCVHHASGSCPDSQSPTFGTGNQFFSGGSTTYSDTEFWDGADGIGARQPGWVAEGDYRATADGARLYVATIAVSGGNH